MMKVHFDIHILQDDHVTIASVDYGPAGEVTGSAKRHPTNAHRSEIGVGLALARLFANLAERHERDTKELMTPEGKQAFEDLWLQQFGAPLAELGSE